MLSINNGLMVLFSTPTSTKCHVISQHGEKRPFLVIDISDHNHNNSVNGTIRILLVAI